MDFHNEILNRFQDITNSQVHMVDAQAETNENLNEVQSETKSKLDKITNLVTGLLVRDSDTPGILVYMEISAGSPGPISQPQNVTFSCRPLGRFSYQWVQQ
jgi:hypothetical protein